MARRYRNYQALKLRTTKKLRKKAEEVIKATHAVMSAVEALENLIGREDISKPMRDLLYDHPKVHYYEGIFDAFERMDEERKAVAEKLMGKETDDDGHTAGDGG